MSQPQSSSPERLRVFLSYSHFDEGLKDKLEAHLSALKRSDLIETWSDRKIEPGQEWEGEIDERLIKADLVLLLISSDFLHSDFCYLTETRNALDRHARGQALVILIVVREVDLKGLPIAQLQMLPKDGHAVTSRFWNDEDEAFKNVAEGVRLAVNEFREQRSLRVELQAQPGIELEPRYLDAAIAGEIPVGATHEVAALVRTNDSHGLKAILSKGDSTGSQYSCKASDVHSESFDARYTVTNGITTSPAYRLTIDAPDLIIQDTDKHLKMERGRDSIAFKFLVKAPSAGEHAFVSTCMRGRGQLLSCC